jgi:hypothetical protein
MLSEIARDLAAAEPRLARALTTVRLPALRRPLVARRGHRYPGAWAAVVLASLLAAIALLTAGLVLDILALACAGAVMTQVSPAVGYLCARARQSRPGPPAARREQRGR